MIHDVIIVGAGPAGSVLAYLLVKRGVQVLIIEKAKLPRYKACGGGLPLKSVRILPFDITPVLEQKAAGGIISYNGRQLVKMQLEDDIAWTITRDSFDHFLVQQAVKAGARLLEGLAVTGIEEQNGHVAAYTQGEKHTSRLLVGADGVNSIVARSMGLLTRRKVGTAIEAEVAVPDKAMNTQGKYATFDFGALPYGYGWIFPKSDHLSAGVFRAKNGKAVGLKKYLDRFIANQAVMADHRLLSWRGHHIPLGGSKEIIHKGRVLLVGDAANLADPWLGEGIYFGICSAKIAADVIVKSIENDSENLSSYSTLVNNQIVDQLFHARRFARVIYRFPHVCSILISKSPLMQDAIFSILRGNQTFRQLNHSSIQNLAKIVVQALQG